MIPGVQRTISAATVVAVTATGVAAVLPTVEPRPLILGLDHMPLAVADLEAASERYRQLGFTLKQGRYHENGIRNRHIKFSDGTEIELITASESRDALTTEYLQHLAQGDGPAFVSFFAPEIDRVAQYFDAEDVRYDRSNGLLSFPERHRLRYLFFGRRTSSPTDRPGHFRHDNGAEAPATRPGEETPGHPSGRADRAWLEHVPPAAYDREYLAGVPGDSTKFGKLTE